MVELQKEDTKRDESSNLPLARIRIIMKSGDPDFGKISNDAVAMVGRATVKFEADLFNIIFNYNIQY